MEGKNQTLRYLLKEQHDLTNDGHIHGKRQFGNYDLIRRIDMGGMGEVYLAHQRTAFHREVAVKLISINPTSVPTVSLPALPTPTVSEGSLTPNV